MNTTVILPAYNEEKAITQVIDEVKLAMDATGREYEILVVDDVSTDNTAKLAEEKGVRVIKRKVQGGSGASRKTGIRGAQGELIAMLDCDGTYTAGDIPKLLDALSQYDQANGARTSEEGTMKFLRAPAKYLIRRLARYLTGVNILDLNTGLKAFRRDTMMRFLWLIPDGFSCVTSMTMAYLCNGLSVTWLPSEYKKRIGSSKFHPIKDTYNYALTVIRMVMYFNPLKVFLPIAIIMFLIGVVKTIYDRFFAVGHMQLSDVLILITSLMVFVIGLLADLIVNQSRALTNKRDE